MVHSLTALECGAKTLATTNQHDCLFKTFVEKVLGVLWTGAELSGGVTCLKRSGASLHLSTWNSAI